VEFCKKLQELRKSRGLTQEELAEALYVSRTAVSKWESCKGYPSIDSLKDISTYFSVSIDDLLSGEKLISFAEKENKANIRNICDLLFGMADIFSFVLIVLPLYPKTVDGYVYSVNLFSPGDISAMNLAISWVLFLSHVLIGVLKVALTHLKKSRLQTAVTVSSMVLSMVTIIFLALTREPYALILLFLLLITKGTLLFKYAKTKA